MKAFGTSLRRALGLAPLAAGFLLTAVASGAGGPAGDDIAFSATNMPAAQAGTVAVSGNGNRTLDPNECASLFIGLTNQTDTAMTGLTVTLASGDPNVIVTQPLAAYPDTPAYSTSTNSSPFQISILPSFVCGHPINLELAVSSTSHGSFIVPVVLGSGARSDTPARHDNNVETNLPDVGTIELTNTVPSWSGGPLTKIAVSLWLVAPSDADLSLTLIAPDGSLVDLSSGNGSGANFGSGTADADRTTFDDEAAIPITTGSPPFVGSFRPESALAGLLGSSAVGNWRLRIQDGCANGAGDTLRAWSLFLHGTTCNPGGGACALCAGGTRLTNTLDATSASMSGRLFRDGVAGTCMAPKACPTVLGGCYYYHAYPFYNATSNRCVTVTLTSTGGADLTSAAYLGEFSPANIRLNHLADSGASTAEPPSVSYSFNVPANALFTVVVNDVGTLGQYTLDVSGGDCPPILSLEPAGPNVQVSWPTIAGGYQLEASRSLSPPVWTIVTNEPIAAGNHFCVSNSVAEMSNRFYRLHKPL